MQVTAPCELLVKFLLNNQLPLFLSQSTSKFIPIFEFSLYESIRIVTLEPGLAIYNNILK